MSNALGKGAAGAPEGQETVLIIDNDPVALELMNRSLPREGFRVLTAPGGEEGLRLAREARPDAILLDVEMPGMNGWEVLAALKADPELATIPVVMATMVDERTKARDLGVADYLVKPLERARLAAVLRQVSAKNSTCRVLIVEDDAANRGLLARLVTKEGWSAVEAENGGAALEQVAANPPDVILLDLVMPVMDGFAFLRELRKNPAFQSIPIVVLSGKDLTGPERLQLSNSVHKVLQKGSYRRDELLQEIGSRVRAQPRAADTGTRAK